MKFPSPLQSATLLKRYKRFLADVELPDGTILTLHCPNTGSMKGCTEPQKTVWYSTSDKPGRRLPHTWECIQLDPHIWVGVNTHRANALVQEAIENGTIQNLQGYTELRREVPYGKENSRIDFLLEIENKPCYVEVKNVTLGEGTQGYFPDAVTTRGQKHLRDLVEQVHQGARAVLCFCVQHTEIQRVSPADHIDETYGRLLREALSQGVEVMAYKAIFSPEEIRLTQEIPVTF